MTLKYKGMGMALFLAMLLGSAQATVFVEIAPKSGVDTLSVYPQEVGLFELKIHNSGPEQVGSVKVQLTADEGLVLFEGLQEVRTKLLSEDRIDAGEIRNVVFKAKPVALFEPGSEEKVLSVTAEYGVTSYTHSTSTFLTVREGPLDMDVSVSKNLVNRGERNSVVLTLANKGAENLTDVEVEVEMPRTLIGDTNRITFESALEPNVSISNKQITFSPAPLADGRQHLLVRVSFSDSSGRHVMEKGLSFTIQDRQTDFAILGGAIVALLVAAYWTQRRRKDEEVRAVEVETTRDELHEAVGQE